MKLLLNDCYRSEIKVWPSNWQTKKASTKKKWRIYYRYYDPLYRHLYGGKGKLIKVQGMNDYKDLTDRQRVTRQLLESEIDLVDKKNYNHFSHICMIPPEPEPKKVITTDTRPITTSTLFVEALDYAYENVSKELCTMNNLKSVLTYTWQAADITGLSSKRISEVERSDIRVLLNKVGDLKGEKWTDNTFNYYRSHLGILYNFLEDFDVFKVNPLLGLKKRKVIREIREVLTDVQFESVMESIKEIDYYFWRFIHIFHRSGGRRPEILRVTDTDVDLPNARYKALVKKGLQFRRVWKDIEPDVLNLWEELMAEAKVLRRKDRMMPIYLFSIGLQPRYRDRPILPEQVTRRWKVHVKEKLGITADLYCLKHFNTTREIDKMIDEAIHTAQKKMAAKNSHTSTKMVENVYDVNASNRKIKAVRQIKEAG